MTKKEMQELIEMLDARIDARVSALAQEKPKTVKKTKKDKAVEVLDERTYHTQQFHKELQAQGMKSGKDYWAHTNKDGKTKVYACVPHTQPDWAKRLEALGFAPTRAYGGSTPAFAMYSRTTDDLVVDKFQFDNAK